MPVKITIEIKQGAMPDGRERLDTQFSGVGDQATPREGAFGNKLVAGIRAMMLEEAKLTQQTVIYEKDLPQPEDGSRVRSPHPEEGK